MRSLHWLWRMWFWRQSPRIILGRLSYGLLYLKPLQGLYFLVAFLLYNSYIPYMQRIYLDNAATTPLDTEVKKAMEPYFDDIYGNPNSLHWFGQQARAAVDWARETIADAIGARFREVIFTGSATEANNLALRGAINKARPTFTALYGDKPMKVIVSAIEHDSVLDTARALEEEGVELVILPVDVNGFVDVQALADALDERTVIVSIMYANNEIGSVQPITEIAAQIAQFRSRENALPYYPLLHVDAVQAFQFLDCTVDMLGVDMMTLSGHKIYGPKGVGVLYARTMDSVTHMQDDRMHIISPRMTGGGQEFGMRSGTENVPAIVGFAKAVELAVARRTECADQIARLHSLFWEQLHGACPEVVLNSPHAGDAPYLPNIINIHIPGQKGGELLIALDLQGVAVSSGSACAARSATQSHVLRALGFSDERSRRSLRFSFGRHTTARDIDGCIAALVRILAA